MTAKQYRSALAKLGLSQVKAGSFLGISPRQPRRFALGERNIPKLVAMMLDAMVKYKIYPGDLDNRFKSRA